MVEGDEVSKTWLLQEPEDYSGNRVDHVEGPESH